MASCTELLLAAKRFVKNVYTEINECGRWHYVTYRRCVLTSKVQTVTK